MRDLETMYCVCSSGGPVVMKKKQSEWIVATKTKNRLIKADLWVCPKCGKQILRGYCLIDEYIDKETHEMWAKRTRKSKRIVFLPDEKYMR